MSKITTRSGVRLRRQARTRGLAIAMAASALSTGMIAGNAATANASRRVSANIQMWIAGNNTTKPIYEAEAAAFSKSHPGINVTITDLPGPAYTQKLDTALAANQLPAIFQEFSPGPALQQLVRSKDVINLTPFVKKNSVITRRILPAALAQGQIHGQQYGIPYNIFQETVILYNRSDFRKAHISAPPQTWAELNTDIGKLKAAGIIPISISGTESDNWYELWLENYEVRHSGLGVTNALKKGRTAALGTAPVVEAARAMQQLVKAKAFEPGYSTISEANDVPYALLGTGKAGMLLYGAFTPNFVNEAVPNFSASGNMGWFSFPSVSGGKDNAVIDLASQPQLVVNAHMSKADITAAEEFLASFVYSPGQVAALSKTGNVGPFANSLYLVKQRAPKDLKSYMLFELNEARQSASFISWSQLLPPSQTTNWNNLLEELFSLAITPSQFAAQAAKL